MCIRSSWFLVIFLYRYDAIEETVWRVIDSHGDPGTNVQTKKKGASVDAPLFLELSVSFAVSGILKIHTAKPPVFILIAKALTDFVYSASSSSICFLYMSQMAKTKNATAETVPIICPITTSTEAS